MQKKVILLILLIPLILEGNVLDQDIIHIIHEKDIIITQEIIVVSLV